MRRDVRDLIERAQRQGWRIEHRKSGGMLAFSPDRKTIVTLHSTPSDRNWQKAAVRELKLGRIRSRVVNENENTRWTVSIQTFEGLGASVAVLEQFADALEVDSAALGAAASLDTERGVLSATFQLEARTQGVAAERGIKAFYSALAAAGYEVERPGWKLKLEIEPDLEEVEAVSVRN